MVSAVPRVSAPSTGTPRKPPSDAGRPLPSGAYFLRPGETGEAFLVRLFR